MLPNTGMNFTPLDELTAEEMNQLVANIEALAAGTGLADAAVTYPKLLSTIFSGQVTSDSNPGTAGGTRKYINLGGIKLCWGITNSITRSGVGGETRGVTLPTSFFSSVTGLASNYRSSSDERNTAKIQSYTTSALTVHMFNYSGGTGGVSDVSWFVIGT